MTNPIDPKGEEFDAVMTQMADERIAMDRYAGLIGRSLSDREKDEFKHARQHERECLTRFAASPEYKRLLELREKYKDFFEMAELAKRESFHRNRIGCLTREEVDAILNQPKGS